MSAIAVTGVPFKFSGTMTNTWSDGAGHSVGFTLIGSLEITVNGTESVEVKERDRHQSTPVELNIADGDCEVTIGGKVTTFYTASGDVSLYEALTFTGACSSWTSVGNGDKKLGKLTTVLTHPNGSTQTLAFNYCKTGPVQINLNGEEGQATLQATLTDRENYPTIS